MGRHTDRADDGWKVGKGSQRRFETRSWAMLGDPVVLGETCITKNIHTRYANSSLWSSFSNVIREHEFSRGQHDSRKTVRVTNGYCIPVAVQRGSRKIPHGSNLYRGWRQILYVHVLVPGYWVKPQQVE